MTKFKASTVKGSGFNLVRNDGQPHYNIVKTGDLVGKQSPNLGFVYKDATTGKYSIRLGLKRNVVEDFNAVKTFLKGALAA